MQVERHQDYLLNVNSVPVGGLIEVPLQLDTDAPFRLRLVRSRNIGLNGWRFQTAERVYQSSGLRTDWIVAAAQGQGPFPSRGSVVYPELRYPAASQILVDLGNATDAPIERAQLLFRGSKSYKEGTITGPEYPDAFSPYPQFIEVVVPNVPNSGSASVFNVNNAAFLQNFQVQAPNDADFVIRYLVCDPYTIGVDGGPVGSAFRPSMPPGLGTITNVYVQIKDESGKPYSNGPIHINDLFGQGLPTPSGSGTD